MSTVTAAATAGRRAAAPLSIIRSQAALEWRLMMANGEQILLTLVIPIVLLVGLSMTSVVSLGADTRAGRLDILVPGILALAVMSSAFTALAIATGFDRRSEAIKFLGTTPLSRTSLLAAKSLAVLGIQAVQITILLAVSLLLGWRPGGMAVAAVPVLILGTAAFAALALAMAGVLRAEATLAAANAVYVLLLLGGGVIVSTDDLPGPWGAIVGMLPSAALADGLRAAMGDSAGAGTIAVSCIILLAWTGAGATAVHRWFRWTS
jgi:ABC-2 type transport system permease protein